jgi:hypothetical protein
MKKLTSRQLEQKYFVQSLPYLKNKKPKFVLGDLVCVASWWGLSSKNPATLKDAPKHYSKNSHYGYIVGVGIQTQADGEFMDLGNFRRKYTCKITAVYEYFIQMNTGHVIDAEEYLLLPIPKDKVDKLAFNYLP